MGLWGSWHHVLCVLPNQGRLQSGKGSLFFWWHLSVAQPLLGHLPGSIFFFCLFRSILKQVVCSRVSDQALEEPQLFQHQPSKHCTAVFSWWRFSASTNSKRLATCKSPGSCPEDISGVHQGLKNKAKQTVGYLFSSGGWLTAAREETPRWRAILFHIRSHVYIIMRLSSNEQQIRADSLSGF